MSYVLPYKNLPSAEGTFLPVYSYTRPFPVIYFFVLFSSSPPTIASIMSTTNIVIGVGVGIAVGWIMRGSARPLISLLRRGKMKPMPNVKCYF